MLYGFFFACLFLVLATLVSVFWPQNLEKQTCCRVILANWFYWTSKRNNHCHHCRFARMTRLNVLYNPDLIITDMNVKPFRYVTSFSLITHTGQETSSSLTITEGAKRDPSMKCSTHFHPEPINLKHCSLCTSNSSCPLTSTQRSINYSSGTIRN